MAETQLITISDLTSYRKIDPKFNTDRFNSFVNSVQRKNLREIFGDALYYDFMNDDRTSGKYKTLVDGESYTYSNQTINYYGLKPLLSFWVLALIARESDLYLSQHGAIVFTENTQQPFVNAKQKDRVAAGYMEEATAYENDLIQYLNANVNTYPLWDGGIESNENEMISFKI